MIKKRHILVLGLAFCLAASFVVASVGYDPWIDTDDDGIIDYQDLYNLASKFRTSGTPINKTALLLELQARIDSLNASLLADYYIKAVCDDLFAPSVHLHSCDDINGGTLRVDEIQLGSSEGNSHIYFYDDETPLGEYISWQDADDEFVASDDIEIQGTLTIPNTTRYYSIPGSAWQPANLYFTYEFTRRAHSIYTFSGGSTYWYASVNLPHGAVVTEFRVWLWDDDVHDILVTLARQTGLSVYTMASVSSSGTSASFVQYADNSIDYATVNNKDYAYHVAGVLESGNSDHRLGQVRITYTITEPLP